MSIRPVILMLIESRDPGQSWNALTVGAFTNNCTLVSDDYEGYGLLAASGGLCPTSRTSCSWDDKTWPLKPDVVFEGGNYARSPNGNIEGCDDLSLLTTTVAPFGNLLTWSGDTSAATAIGAQSAGTLLADYPDLWPETIRGLLVHSAEWTPEMLRQIAGSSQSDIQNRLRCFGYGVPNLEKARYALSNHVSLIHEGSIQPFKLDGSEVKTNQFITHKLPWPKEVLESLHDKNVTIKITLSYFIEPSPAGRGWGKSFAMLLMGFALRSEAHSKLIRSF